MPCFLHLPSETNNVCRQSSIVDDASRLIGRKRIFMDDSVDYSHAKEICVPVIPLSFYFFLHCISPWRFSSPVMLLCGAKSRHHRKVFVTCQDLSSITIITFLVGTSKTLATLPKPASTRCKPSTRFHPRQVRLMYMYYAYDYRNRGILDGFFAHTAIQSIPIY